MPIGEHLGCQQEIQEESHEFENFFQGFFSKPFTDPPALNQLAASLNDKRSSRISFDFVEIESEKLLETTSQNFFSNVRLN